MRGTGPAPRPAGGASAAPRAALKGRWGAAAPPYNAVPDSAVPDSAVLCPAASGGSTRVCAPTGGVWSHGGGRLWGICSYRGVRIGYVHPQPCGSVHTQAARRCVQWVIGVGA